MKEIPIIFSGPMVRAILEGRKTQTRRVLKPQPEPLEFDGWMFGDEYFADDEQMRDHLFHNVYGNGQCPYGSVYADGNSDLLWVRETWASHRGMDDTSPAEFGPGAQTLSLWYRADIGNTNRERGRWRASIHMPRWASRLTLGIVDVRVERLQQMTFADWIADFAPTQNEQNKARETFTGAAYQQLHMQAHWDSINAKRGHPWHSNPWVWVVEFEIEQVRR